MIFDSYQYLLILAWWPCTLRQQDYTEARKKRLSSIGRSQNEKMRNGAVEEQTALSHSLDVIACPCLTPYNIRLFSKSFIIPFFGTKMWLRTLDPLRSFSSPKDISKWVLLFFYQTILSSRVFYSHHTTWWSGTILLIQDESHYKILEMVHLLIFNNFKKILYLKRFTIFCQKISYNFFFIQKITLKFITIY